MTLPPTELVYEEEAQREAVKKMVRLRERVDPPPSLFFLILLDVIWAMPKETIFFLKKAAPYCCCSVTNWLDGGIAKA